jgi:hypothetical protein
MTLFYTGEAMHREREARIEPLLWSMPVPNGVLILSKFFASLALIATLMVTVGVVAIAIQMIRGHGPIEIRPFLMSYSIVVVPAAAFLIAVVIVLNVILRDKYLTYAVGIAKAGGLFYLNSLGYNGWLYNPLLYQLWKYGDLSGGAALNKVLLHRAYCLAIASAALAFAVLSVARKSTRSLVSDGRLSGTGWSTLFAIVSAVLAGMIGIVLIR